MRSIISKLNIQLQDYLEVCRESSEESGKRCKDSRFGPWDSYCVTRRLRICGNGAIPHRLALGELASHGQMNVMAMLRQLRP